MATEWQKAVGRAVKPPSRPCSIGYLKSGAVRVQVFSSRPVEDWAKEVRGRLDAHGMLYAEVIVTKRCVTGFDWAYLRAMVYPPEVLDGAQA